MRQTWYVWDYVQSITAEATPSVCKHSNCSNASWSYPSCQVQLANVWIILLTMSRMLWTLCYDLITWLYQQNRKHLSSYPVQLTGGRTALRMTYMERGCCLPTWRLFPWANLAVWMVPPSWCDTAWACSQLNGFSVVMVVFFLDMLFHIECLCTNRSRLRSRYGINITSSYNKCPSMGDGWMNW